jgi:hypothetical protein
VSNALAISTTIIGLVINGIGLMFIAVQVVLARRQLRDSNDLSTKENLRLKRQATIDFYMSTAERVAAWRSVLPDDWDKREIDAYTERIYGQRDRDRAQTLVLASYLGFWEALAVAIRAGIYDLAVFDSISGSRILNICENYQDFFVARREEVGTDLAYNNLEWLGTELRIFRASPGYNNSPLKEDTHALMAAEGLPSPVPSPRTP